MRNKATREASDADHNVGKRLRQLRRDRGITIQTLAVMLNVSHQQVYKYEIGLNRISAGRLYEIAEKMGVSVATFYDGLRDVGEQALPHHRMRLNINQSLQKISCPDALQAIGEIVQVIARRAGL